MMNTHAALSLFVCFCFLYQHINTTAINNDSWHLYKQKYGLSFEANEDQSRRKIFEDNLHFINKVNAENRTYTLGMNNLGHLTIDELVRGFDPKALKKDVSQNTDYHIRAENRLNNYELPAEVDWRTVGAVSPVKNQRVCGSCWAFSTTGAIEGQYKLTFGHLKRFSEQQLVSCDTDTNMGCYGGLPSSAYNYARKVGLLTEEEYPYTAQDDACKLHGKDPKKYTFTKISGYRNIDAVEESLTKAIYALGPVSVAIDARQREFHFYKDGVYENENCGNSLSSLDHAVLAVGYGHDHASKKDYYIVKNSWGDKGYIKMVRNAGNNCGIATAATIPYF